MASAAEAGPPLSEVKVSENEIYSITEVLLGEGGFGKVYVGVLRGDKKVAVKFGTNKREKNKRENNKSETNKRETKERETHPNSEKEWQAYKALDGIDGVPHMHYGGIQADNYITVLDLLGPSLRAFQKRETEEVLSVEMVNDVATQAISTLQNVHSRGYVHSDIKPANFLLGPPDGKVFLTDFGLATRWKDDSGNHVEYDQKPLIRRFSGTVDYASVHTQLGRKRSRRDDMESLAYTLISLRRGKLPWHNKHAEGESRKFLVCKEKMNTAPESLCRGLPQTFREFLEYVVELLFEEEPDYAGCISLFKGTGRPTRSTPKLPIQVRTGECNNTQWISVYDARQPMKQRYHYGVETANLEHFIGKGKEENLFISSVASCENLWALIIDAGTGFSHQIYEHEPDRFPEVEWLKQRWKEGFFITAIAGADNGSSLIVMSKGTQYKQQAFHAAAMFPFEWIQDKQKAGFYITSMATAGSEWAVVMSCSDGDVVADQVIELDFVYPFEGIHQRWAKGFRITATAATPDQAAFVFTRTKNPTGEHGQQDPHQTDDRRQQDTYRTSKFPSKYIMEKWPRNIYITGLCYGRTIS